MCRILRPQPHSLVFCVRSGTEQKTAHVDLRHLKPNYAGMISRLHVFKVPTSTDARSAIRNVQLPLMD
jgi:hypothetical protein